MDDELTVFDLDLAEALLDRDGALPEPVERPIATPLTLTDYDQDVLIDALSFYINGAASDVRDRERGALLLDRVEAL